jgi:Transposase IS200 like
VPPDIIVKAHITYEPYVGSRVSLSVLIQKRSPARDVRERFRSSLRLEAEGLLKGILMKYELRTNNARAYICHFHVVFCSKYRRKVLIPPIDKRLKTSILETIEKWGQEFIELEVTPDHVQRHGGM